MTAGGGGPEPPSAASVDEALVAMADGLEARAEEIARRVEEVYRAEIPEYGRRVDSFEEDSFAVTLAGARGAVMILRGQAPPRDLLLRQWQQFGRRRAEQDFPLSAVVHAFQVGMRVFIEYVAEEAPRFGGLSGAVVLRAVSELMDVVTDGVASVSEAYEAARRDAAAGRRRVVEAFFSDLVLGVVSDADTARASASGLDPAPAYATFATPLGEHEDIDSLSDVALGGCLWGRVGNVAVVIAPVRSPDELPSIMDALFDDAMRLVASGGPRSGLLGVRAAYEDVVQTLELARRLGLGGRVSRRDVLVPGLLASTPDYASQLAALIEPLVEADGQGEARLVPTLRAYLASGMSPYKTAAALFVHRNTLRARLRRIELLLGAPVIDIHLALQLALLARDLDLPSASREIP